METRLIQVMILRAFILNKRPGPLKLDTLYLFTCTSLGAGLYQLSAKRGTGLTCLVMYRTLCICMYSTCMHEYTVPLYVPPSILVSLLGLYEKQSENHLSYPPPHLLLNPLISCHLLSHLFFFAFNFNVK